MTAVIDRFIREAWQRLSWDAVIAEPRRDATDLIELACTRADILAELVM